MSTASRSRTHHKRLDLGCAGITMTPEEFDAIRRVDDRFRYELIRGVVVVSRLVSVGEVGPNQDLGRHLLNYADTPQGAILDGTLPERYVIGTANRRRADRLIWTGLGRTPDEETDLPTIVVEFVSKSKSDWLRDYEEKRDEYLAAGIAEYWVIDRFKYTMTVYRQTPTGPNAEVLPADATLRTPLLPGFELPLARLFAAADKWKK